MEEKTVKELIEWYKDQYIEKDTVSSKLKEINDKYGFDVRETKEYGFKVMKEKFFYPFLKILNKEEKELFNNFEIITHPLGVINAFSEKASDGYLVVFNTRLMALIFSYHEIQFTAIKDFNNKRDFAKKFVSLVDCYLSVNSAEMLKTYSFNEISPVLSSVITALTLFNELFILAHEMAHIYLGHFTNNVMYPYMSFLYNAPNIDQEKEYSADIQAVIWISRYCSLVKTTCSVSNCIEIFMLFHLIECNTKFPSKNASHPSALNRLINIRENCERYLTQKDIEFIDAMIENAKDIDSFRMY